MNSLDKKLPLNNKKIAMKKYIPGFRDIKNIKHCSNIVTAVYRSNRINFYFVNQKFSVTARCRIHKRVVFFCTLRSIAGVWTVFVAFDRRLVRGVFIEHNIDGGIFCGSSELISPCQLSSHIFLKTPIVCWDNWWKCSIIFIIYCILLYNHESFFYLKKA